MLDKYTETFIVFFGIYTLPILFLKEIVSIKSDFIQKKEVMDNPMHQWGEDQPSRDPKTIAIVAYLTIVGCIIAMIWNNPRSEQASFHIRQSLGLMLIWMGSRFVAFVPFFGHTLARGLSLGAFVLLIIGLIGAVQGQQKPVPVLGEYFQEWFKTL